MIDIVSKELVASPVQAIPSRVKGIRMQLGLSRKKFEQATGISSNTLQAWELGKNHLTEKAASKLCLALEKIGVNCTVDWLLHGNGIPPRAFQTSEQSFDEDVRILKEVAFFEANNPSSIVIIVMDDAMMPFYKIGDYVAGCQKSSEYTDLLVGTNCIVTLYSGKMLLRHLSKDVHGCYNLYSLNPDTQVENACVLDCKIQRIAQVVWHRTNELILK
ncbi:helix-turn-helix transcriptional regulator [Shewanella sp. 202IG2-18]|uniref:helix-turn-helix domain-containing protein n=1 Tax=Parashewanella hymeniacidonis TaxID=2807618 RepID=UPI001961E1F3|nr:helix-turn-helix transcriptional regulator [Parashewanella hymeniacidonis]